jgi:hypothetical protein
VDKESRQGGATPRTMIAWPPWTRRAGKEGLHRFGWCARCRGVLITHETLAGGGVCHAGSTSGLHDQARARVKPAVCAAGVGALGPGGGGADADGPARRGGGGLMLTRDSSHSERVRRALTAVVAAGGWGAGGRRARAWAAEARASGPRFRSPPPPAARSFCSRAASRLLVFRRDVRAATRACRTHCTVRCGACSGKYFAAYTSAKACVRVRVQPRAAARTSRATDVARHDGEPYSISRVPHAGRRGLGRAPDVCGGGDGRWCCGRSGRGWGPGRASRWTWSTWSPPPTPSPPPLARR